MDKQKLQKQATKNKNNSESSLVTKHLVKRKIFQDYANLFNSIIEKNVNSNFAEILGKVNGNVFITYDSTEKLIFFNEISNENTPFYKLFNSIAPIRLNDKGQFFHFFSNPKWVFNDLLRKKTIQATSLSSLSSNDFTEYIEFFKRINSKYIFEKTFEKDKQNRYVLCFTKNWRNERFWEEYADSHKGVCVGFRFIKKNNELNGVHFRDVYYDSGYDFEFINELRYEFIKTFGKELFLYGGSRFANFYKRDKFKWEDETRLLIDTNVNDNSVFSNKLDDIGKKHSDKGRNYFEFNVNNMLFKLEVSEIIVGKNSNINIDKLKTNDLYKTINIWKNRI